MPYLVIGEEIYRYNEPLFNAILESLKTYTMSKTTERIVTIEFESDKFKGFCIAMIKNDRKTREPFFWGIIQGENLIRHLAKK